MPVARPQARPPGPTCLPDPARPGSAQTLRCFYSRGVRGGHEEAWPGAGGTAPRRQAPTPLSWSPWTPRGLSAAEESKEAGGRRRGSAGRWHPGSSLGCGHQKRAEQELPGHSRTGCQADVRPWWQPRPCSPCCGLGCFRARDTRRARLTDELKLHFAPSAVISSSRRSLHVDRPAFQLAARTGGEGRRAQTLPPALRAPCGADCGKPGREPGGPVTPAARRR